MKMTKRRWGVATAGTFIVAAAATLTGFVVQRRIGKLDLVEVLKTRE